MVLTGYTVQQNKEDHAKLPSTLATPCCGKGMLFRSCEPHRGLSLIAARAVVAAVTDQTGRVARVAFEQALGSNFLEVPTRPLFLTVR